jgi:hypothetical protein
LLWKAVPLARQVCSPPWSSSGIINAISTTESRGSSRGSTSAYQLDTSSSNCAEIGLVCDRATGRHIKFVLLISLIRLRWCCAVMRTVRWLAGKPAAASCPLRRATLWDRGIGLPKILRGHTHFA